MATFYTCLHNYFRPELIRSSGDVFIPSSIRREVNYELTRYITACNR